MIYRQAILILFLLFSLLGGISGQALAQETQPTPSDDDVNRVAKQMYCPVCENIPLDVCPTQACNEWRELIRLKLSEGKTVEEIKIYFAAQYGDRVLAEPPRQGLNWLIYIIPPAFIAIGAVVVWRILQSMKRQKPQAAVRDVSSPQPGPDDPYLARLEEELKKSE